MDLVKLAEDLREFLIQSEDQYWYNWIGLQDEIDLEPVFERFGHVLSRDAVLAGQAALRAATDPEEIRRLRSLLGQLILSHMEHATREDNLEALRRESATRVILDGRKVAWRSLGPKMRNEPDRGRRALLMQKQSQAVARRINPFRRPMVERFFGLIRELGYGDYAELNRETQDRDFDAFAREMELFLDASQELYERELDRYLKAEAGVSRRDANRGDMAYMSRFTRFDRHFPADQLVTAVKETWKGLGIDLDAMPNITLDLEERPKKTPRACVMAIRPPEDVRLNILPMGGYDDFGGFLHESGHAVHFAHMREDLPILYRYWGDRGFTEGTAYLFQHLTHNPVWLAEMVGYRQPEEFLRASAFMNLMHIRRLICQFLYQLELFRRQETTGMARRYRSIMEWGLGVQVSSAGHLGFDMEFYSAGYVRARLFERKFRSILEERFGLDWWRKPEAGEFLVGFFREGRRLRAEEVLESLGEPNLDPLGYLKANQEVLV